MSALHSPVFVLFFFFLMPTSDRAMHLGGIVKCGAVEVGIVVIGTLTVATATTHVVENVIVQGALPRWRGWDETGKLRKIIFFFLFLSCASIWLVIIKQVTQSTFSYGLSQLGKRKRKRNLSHLFRYQIIKLASVNKKNIPLPVCSDCKSHISLKILLFFLCAGMMETTNLTLTCPMVGAAEEGVVAPCTAMEVLHTTGVRAPRWVAWCLSKDSSGVQEDQTGKLSQGMVRKIQSIIINDILIG